MPPFYPTPEYVFPGSAAMPVDATQCSAWRSEGVLTALRVAHLHGRPGRLSRDRATVGPAQPQTHRRNLREQTETTGSDNAGSLSTAAGPRHAPGTSTDWWEPGRRGERQGLKRSPTLTEELSNGQRNARRQQGRAHILWRGRDPTWPQPASATGPHRAALARRRYHGRSHADSGLPAEPRRRCGPSRAWTAEHLRPAHAMARDPAAHARRGHPRHLPGHQAPPRPTSGWSRWSTSWPRPRPRWPGCWRPPRPSCWPSTSCPVSTGPSSGAPTRWSASTARSAGAPTWSASSPTTPPCCAWLACCSSSKRRVAHRPPLPLPGVSHAGARPRTGACHLGGRPAHPGLNRPTTILNYTTNCDLTVGCRDRPQIHRVGGSLASDIAPARLHRLCDRRRKAATQAEIQPRRGQIGSGDSLAQGP